MSIGWSFLTPRTSTATAKRAFCSTPRRISLATSRGVLAFGAFIEPDVNCLNGVQRFGSALGEQIRQAWSNPCGNHGCAVLFLEALVEAKLFSLEDVAG